MAVTVISNNALAVPADPKCQYHIELRGTMQVGTSVIEFRPNWTDPMIQAATMLSGWPNLTYGPDLDRTLRYSELLQAYLDGVSGNLITRYIRYPDRARFPAGSLPICLYRIDEVGRIQEIDDVRSRAQFPGAVYEKEIRTI